MALSVELLTPAAPLVSTPHAFISYLEKELVCHQGTAFGEAVGNRLGLYLNQVPGLQDQESGTPSSFIDTPLIVIPFTRNAPAPNKKPPPLKGPLHGTETHA